MKRRILAALMCLCMLVGLLPTSVFAKKSELPESNDTVEYTASRVENISKLDGNKSTNDQIVAAAIWKTVENGQEMFYVAVAYAKQHVNEQPENGTDSRWEVIGGDKRLNVTINEKVEFSEVPSKLGKTNTKYWYIAAFTKQEMSEITVSEGEYKFTLPPLPGGFKLDAITLPKDFVEEEILDKVTLSGQFVSAYAGEVSDEELAEVNAGEYISVTKSPGTAGNQGEITFTVPKGYVITGYRVNDGSETSLITEDKGKEGPYLYTGSINEDTTVYVSLAKDVLDGDDTPDGGDGIPDHYQAVVTYQVVGGSWDDGTSDNKTEVVTFRDQSGLSEAGTSALHNVPVTGAPDANHNNSGSWSPDTPVSNQTIVQKPATDNTITYTYTFDAKDPTPTDKVTVTYKIVGGTWENKKTEIKVELNKNATLGNTIPDVSKAVPTVGYKNTGRWSTPAPENNTCVTGSVAYTYRFDEDPVWTNTYNTIRIYMDQGTTDDFNNLNGRIKQVYVESDKYISGSRGFAYEFGADFWYTTNLAVKVSAGDIKSIILSTAQERIVIPAAGNQDYSVTFSEGKYGINNKRTYLRIDIAKKTPSSDNYILTYNANGGEFVAEDPVETVREVNVSKDAANNYPLGQEEGFVNPSHANKDGVAVAFGGWTTEDTQEAVYAGNAADVPNAITKLTMTEDDIVYAIWGEDKNDNGIPDYKEEDAYFYVLKPGKVDATGTDPQNFFYVGQGSIFKNTQDVTKFTDDGVKGNISKLPDEDKLGEIGAGDITGNVGENFSNVLWYRVTTANGANSNNSGSPIFGPGTSTRHVDGLLKPEDGKYGMIFMYNGGAVYYVTIGANSKISPDALAAANNAALTAAGKPADQWNVVWKNADGRGADVANATGEAGQLLFFYADFDEKTATYTLTYNGNAQQSGTVNYIPKDSNSYPVNADVTLITNPNPKPTHTAVKVNLNDEKATAVVFIGWTSEQTNKIYSKNDAAPTTVTSVTMIVDGKTVYAAWGYDTNSDGIADATEVNVTFGAGAHGTLNGKNTTTVAKGGTLSSSQIPAVFANTNYTFTGWKSIADGKVYSNYDLTQLTISGAVTFVAQYQYYNPGSGYDHYVYYYPNFNGGSARNEGFDTGDTVTVKENTWLERDGYVFVCWNTEAKGSGTRYDPDDTFTMPDHNVYLYAQWQKEKPGPDDTGVSNWLETDEHNAYLTGYPDNTFRADRNMTRAEVAQMFYALLLDKNVTITKSFSDVPDDAWYATAVKTLASLGMMDGYPDGTFRPDEPITRAEFATVGLAFAYDPLDADCSYYDVSASAWYHTYVAQATTYGWIGGYPDNTFRPGNNITRVEVCVIVNNMLGRDADERYIDRHEDELVHFVDLSDSYWGYYTIMESTNTHEYTGSFTNEKWTDVK